MSKDMSTFAIASNFTPVAAGKPARSVLMSRETRDTAMASIWNRGRYTAWDPSFRTDVSPTAAVGTADIAANSTTMNVSATGTGAYAQYMELFHPALPAGCYITSLGTYSGGVGTVNISAAPTVAIAAGTINAIGGKVSVVTDRSPVASNAVQATGANQPLLLKNYLGNFNGEDRDALFFDGTTTQNLQSANTFNGGNSWSFAFAARLGTTGNRQIFCSLGASSDFGFFFTSGTACGFGNGGAGLSLTLPTNVIGSVVRGYGTMFYPGSGNITCTLNVNGATASSSSIPLAGKLPGTGGVIIGAYRTPTLNQYSGEIFEVAFANSVITSDQGAATMSYFDSMLRTLVS